MTVLKRRRRGSGPEAHAPGHDVAPTDGGHVPTSGPTLEVATFEYVRAGDEAVIWLDGHWSGLETNPRNVKLTIETSDHVEHEFSASPELRPDTADESDKVVWQAKMSVPLSLVESR